jgi:hypothetical protein
MKDPPAIGPAPCDDCALRPRCAVERIECVAFRTWVNDGVLRLGLRGLSLDPCLPLHSDFGDPSI